MIIRHLKTERINGSLITLDGVKEASFDEVATLYLSDGTKRTGRVVKIEGETVTLQVFEGSRGISAFNTSTVFEGSPIELALSPEILGRVFDGLGRPIDGLGEIYPHVVRDVNGAPINPVSREYPRNFIQTGNIVNRRARYACSRSKAADIFRIRNEAQRACRSDCKTVYHC